MVSASASLTWLIVIPALTLVEAGMVCIEDKVFKEEATPASEKKPAKKRANSSTKGFKFQD